MEFLHYEVDASPATKKREASVADLAGIFQVRKLTPSAAEKMRGKLGFAQSCMFGKFGRAMIDPFQHASTIVPTWVVMRLMLIFSRSFRGGYGWLEARRLVGYRLHFRARCSFMWLRAARVTLASRFTFITRRAWPILMYLGG